MILVLQDYMTAGHIGEQTVESVPAIKSTITYNSTNYVVLKRISPTLNRDGEKVIRLRVRAS